MSSTELVDAGDHRQVHHFELEEVQPLVDDQEEDDLDAEEEHAYHYHGHDMMLLRPDREVVRYHLEHHYPEHELVKRLQMLYLPILPVQVL